jgi:hypothetical protein
MARFGVASCCQYLQRRAWLRRDGLSFEMPGRRQQAQFRPRLRRHFLRLVHQPLGKNCPVWELRNAAIF